MTNEDIGIFRELNAGGNFVVAGRTGRPAYFQALVNVAMGDYFNASKSYVDLMTTGSVTGLMSAHNMEMRFALTPMAAGVYCCAEHEFVCQASTTIGGESGGINSAFGYYRASGDVTALADFNAKAALFNLQGLAAVNGNIFMTGSNAASNASLRIRIDGVSYYIMLTTTPSTT